MSLGGSIRAATMKVEDRLNSPGSRAPEYEVVAGVSSGIVALS